MSLKRISRLSVVIIVFLNIQCTNNTEKKIKFENNRWYQSETLSLKYNNESEDNLKSLHIDLNYVYGSQFSDIPLEIFITTPLRQVNKFPLVIKVLDNEQNELGNCVGDYCDIKTTILENYNFEELGSYKIDVLNKFPNKYLPNIVSAGIEID